MEGGRASPRGDVLARGLVLVVQSADDGSGSLEPALQLSHGLGLFAQLVLQLAVHRAAPGPAYGTAPPEWRWRLTL
jgi:hypothetical protein